MCFEVFPDVYGKERGLGFRHSRTVAVVLAEDVPDVQSSLGPPRRSGNHRKTRKHDLSHAVVEYSEVPARGDGATRCRCVPRVSASG